MNPGVKKDKSHPVIYHRLMDMLKAKAYCRTYGTCTVLVRFKVLQFDVVNDRINDCIKILVIIAHMSLDIY